MRLCPVGLHRAVSGVEASQLFTAHRRVLLEDLASNSHDKSLAGRVDPLIVPLVSFINDNYEQYVTTSSCSGRLALFHRGRIEDAMGADQLLEALPAASPNIEGTQNTNKARKRGGFGLGTLFQSHEPLPHVEDAVDKQLLPALSRFWCWRLRFPLATLLTVETEVLQLKFEPMIVHILCRDIEAASALLQCASESAQGNSGIISCSRGTTEHRKITCCITSPVAFDLPLFSEGRWLLPTASSPAAMDDSAFTHEGTAWRAMLMQAVAHANALFAENAKRTERFRQVLERRERPSAGVRRGTGE